MFFCQQFDKKLSIFDKKLPRSCGRGRKLSKFVEKVVKMPKNGSSAYEMSNFTSLLFHRSTLSLVRAHMERLGGGHSIWGGSGGRGSPYGEAREGGRGVRDPKNRKKPKKTSKIVKKSIFWPFFLVFGCFWPEPRENMGKMVKNGQKRGQKWSKTAQKQGFLGISGKTSKRTSAPYGTFWPRNP